MSTAGARKRLSVVSDHRPECSQPQAVLEPTAMTRRERISAPHTSGPALRSAPHPVNLAQDVDRESAGRYIDDAAIYIEGDRIKAVGPAAAIVPNVPAAAIRIDLPTGTLLPGLIDCHTHLMARLPPGDGWIRIRPAPR